MCSSGTEATMSAIRLARGFTGRQKIVKFEGCYHGHSDSLLVKAGSGMLTLGVPTSPGRAARTRRAHAHAVVQRRRPGAASFAELGAQIACVIVEPVAGNMNCIPPVPGFLEALREECTRHGAVLIFDEVMTGFRVAKGGAQQLYGIKPDLTTLGKIVGGGMPVGVFGGRRDVMSHIAPLGPVYQAGTLSGNPVAMAAGLATLNGTRRAGLPRETRGADRPAGARHRRRREAGRRPARDQPRLRHVRPVLHIGAATVTSYADATRCDVERFKMFFHGMLDEGVYLAPSAFEAGFVSIAHTEADIDATIAAAAGSSRGCDGAASGAVPSTLFTAMHGAPREDARATAFAVVKDEIYNLRAFFDHHRRLGVDQFIVLDDRSGDGTREWLARAGRHGRARVELRVRRAHSRSPGPASCSEPASSSSRRFRSVTSPGATRSTSTPTNTWCCPRASPRCRTSSRCSRATTCAASPRT